MASKIPKLKTQQEVYDHVCAYMENVAMFRVPYQGMMLCFYDNNMNFSSPVGSLFNAERLKPKDNIKYIGEVKGTSSHIILELIRKQHGLKPNQKINIEFLEDLEECIDEIVPNVKNRKKLRREFLENVAVKYKLKPYKFSK